MGYNDIYRIAALIVKSIKGKESEEERNELDAWRNASDRNGDYIRNIRMLSILEHGLS